MMAAPLTRIINVWFPFPVEFHAAATMAGEVSLIVTMAAILNPMRRVTVVGAPPVGVKDAVTLYIR